MASRSASSKVLSSGRQYSWSHSIGTLIASELLQEADVVVVEQPEVRDAVLEHRDPLYPHAECEPLLLLRVVAVVGHVGEHVGVDHAGAEDLDPGRPLAQRAALPVGGDAVDAVEAGHVD